MGAHARWPAFVSRAQAQPHAEAVVAQHACDLRVQWLLLASAATFGAGFVWVRASWASAVLGLVVGASLAAWLSLSNAIKLHWFELCHWSHLIVGYGTVFLAVLERLVRPDGLDRAVRPLPFPATSPVPCVLSFSLRPLPFPASSPFPCGLSLSPP